MSNAHIVHKTVERMVDKGGLEVVASATRRKYHPT